MNGVLTEAKVQVFNSDIKEYIKPLVEFMQARLKALYPEQDFTFTDNEWVRDQPDLYEMRVDWYRWAYREGQVQDYLVTRLELIRPERIAREVWDFGETNLQFLPSREYLQDQFKKFEVLHFASFELDTTYSLRLIW